MMKIKIAAFLLFIGFVSNLNAQHSNNIIGKWAFEDAAPEDKAKMDAKSLKMLSMFFGEMTLYFKADGNYNMVIMGGPDNGRWNWVEGQEKIKLNSNKGDGVQVDILEVTNEKLIIKMAKGAFVMRKISVLPEDEVVEIVTVIEGVSASVEQVSKKWFFKSRETQIKSGQSEVVMELMQGAYLNLNNNGTFEAKVIGLSDAASWRFGEDNKSIILVSEGMEKKWMIKSVTDTELVLVRGNNEIWGFSTIKQ
jgi:hypothetical protein